MTLQGLPGLLLALFAVAGGAARAQSFDTLLQQLDAITDPSLEERIVNDFLGTRTPPIVEGDRVHFLYRGTGEHVAVPGEMNRWSPAHAMMKRVEGTDLFYRTEQLPAAARVEYKLWVDSAWMLDPWNPLVAQGGYGANSELRMPGYATDDDASLAEAGEHGRLDTFTLASQILRRSHPVTVYTPPGYDGRTAYPVLLVTDGGEYISLGKLPSILDNLITGNQITPLVAVFIDPRTNPADRFSTHRMTDYAASATFLDFLERELMPEVEQRCTVTDKAQERTILGASMGGIIAAYAALTRTGFVRNAIAQSPAFFQADSAVIKTARQLTSSEAVIALQTGTVNDTREEASIVHAALRAKGVDVSYEEFPEGHNWTNWRVHVSRALRRIFPPSR